MDEDLLVNTRKRRANAGSRLKQLLSAEEVPEEDVDLLFVEDEDDAEYKSDEESEEESEQGIEEEQDEEKGDVSEVSATSREPTTENQADDEESEEGEEQNDDEMFSDSSENESSEESDIGEKELQKQERVQKKRKHIIPKIKQPVVSKPKAKKVYEAPKADALLSETRRQSSRKMAVQSKLDLVEKLKDEEKRRSSIKPVARVEYKEMTQEERLAEALETEKYNISTLNKYKEQEYDKQKKRREIMMNKRRKLTDVITVKTFVKFVEIEEERELEKFLLTRDVLKKRDRRGRKSEKQKKEEDEARKKEQELKEKWELLNNPGKSAVVSQDRSEEDTPIQASVPSAPSATLEVRLEKLDDDVEMLDSMQVSEKQDSPNVEMLGAQPIENPEKQELTNVEEIPAAAHSSISGRKYQIPDASSNPETLDSLGAPVPVKDSITKDTKVEKPHFAFNAQSAYVGVDDVPDESTQPCKKSEDAIRVNDQKAGFVSPDSSNNVKQISEFEVDTEAVDHSIEQQLVESTEPRADSVASVSTDVAPPSLEISVMIQPSAAKARNDEKVDIAESIIKAEPEEAQSADTHNNDPLPEQPPDVKTVKFADEADTATPLPEDIEIIYEGPKQKVGVNIVAFENRYTINKLRALLFGEQVLIPVNRRSLETEPQFRIRLDEDDEHDKISAATTVKPVDFTVLDAFPEFGDFTKKRTQVQRVEQVETTKVVLKTSPPSGITLKNGNRKMCLITGKDAMYFHPGTGMPYSSVESFKVINDVQNGEFKWVEGGFIGNYHAKGVPEGFDI
jgi:vacuolar protein sorting-associated protein 72